MVFVVFILSCRILIKKSGWEKEEEEAGKIEQFAAAAEAQVQAAAAAAE